MAGLADYTAFCSFKRNADGRFYAGGVIKILPTKKQKEFAYKKICFMNKAAI